MTGGERQELYKATFEGSSDPASAAQGAAVRRALEAGRVEVDRPERPYSYKRENRQLLAKLLNKTGADMAEPHEPKFRRGYLQGYQP